MLTKCNRVVRSCSVHVSFLALYGIAHLLQPYPFLSVLAQNKTPPGATKTDHSAIWPILNWMLMADKEQGEDTWRTCHRFGWSPVVLNSSKANTFLGHCDYLLEELNNQSVAFQELILMVHHGLEPRKVWYFYIFVTRQQISFISGTNPDVPPFNPMEFVVLLVFSLDVQFRPTNSAFHHCVLL